jgi:hypothetical protein
MTMSAAGDDQRAAHTPEPSASRASSAPDSPGGVLTPGSDVTVSTSELALLIAMVAAFVAALIAVNRFEKTD